MNFSQFHSSLYETIVGADTIRLPYCGRTVMQTGDGRIFIDNNETCFFSIDEALIHLDEEIKLQQFQKNLKEKISYDKVADIIRQHDSDVKVTNTLIESYIKSSKDKVFSTDPVIQDVRRLNVKFEGYVDYKLDDNSYVIITEDTQKNINKLLGEHQDIIRYMRSCQKNFKEVLKEIEE